MSWDLQTGGLVGAIELEDIRTCLSVTYSVCGTMFATLFHSGPAFVISVHNVLFGMHIYSRSVDGRPLNEIWTHGEYLRFATMESGSITTWEVGFASPHTPTRVESLPVPDGFDPSREYRFHPTSSRLAFTIEESVLVWDARDSKFLLKSTDVNGHVVVSMSFSPNGRSFVCGIGNLGIYLWKESPTGFTPHRKLVSHTRDSQPLLSPNGESIVAFGGLAIQLWRTMDSVTPLPDVSTPTFQRSETAFISGFSSDELLAAVARMEDEMVVVLDLKSGIARLTVDTGMKVYGMRVAGSIIVIVGDGKIVTWNLLAGSDVLNPKVNVNDSVLTTTFNYPPFPPWVSRPTPSVSPDLRHMAMMGWDRGSGNHRLYLYDVPTGQYLASAPAMRGICPWFTLDGCEIRYILWRDVERWGIIQDSESNVTRLGYLGSSTHRLGEVPWQSSRGYEVTDSRWVLSPSKKRLLWLPPSWRSDRRNSMWSGRFLALLDRELPEPVILEFEG
ncbi:hypothetical protein BDM02DRAFT_2987686 [Thelephora ganbajun]|uniref:Uncharacterized protein n=1 Tax=Thelephora ganbajun TaxID=370292 RepID=A0ACB6ZA93_THEGA|nr:hypothetical protein BDM02DRAFT_2987686 [Thelephora ganbajun]